MKNYTNEELFDYDSTTNTLLINEDVLNLPVKNKKYSEKVKWQKKPIMERILASEYKSRIIKEINKHKNCSVNIFINPFDGLDDPFAIEPSTTITNVRIVKPDGTEVRPRKKGKGM